MNNEYKKRVDDFYIIETYKNDYKNEVVKCANGSDRETPGDEVSKTIKEYPLRINDNGFSENIKLSTFRWYNRCPFGIETFIKKIDFILNMVIKNQTRRGSEQLRLNWILTIPKRYSKGGIQNGNIWKYNIL